MANERVVRSALRVERTPIRRAVLAGLLVAFPRLVSVARRRGSSFAQPRSQRCSRSRYPWDSCNSSRFQKRWDAISSGPQTHRAALGVMGHVRASVARLLEPLVPAGLGPRSSDIVDVVVRDVDRVQDLLTAVAGPLLRAVSLAS